ncbi:MAG: Asp23/Gls24 family envelope stress response protein [Angelakisella sp.]
MIGFENTLGSVEISQEYFANLVGRAASECFGVSGMISSPYQGIKSMISSKESPDRGVRVRTDGGKLVIELHIAVTYGVNISAIVKSIVHKVRYTVEQSTGFHVAKVNVYVDSMTAQ